MQQFTFAQCLVIQSVAACPCHAYEWGVRSPHAHMHSTTFRTFRSSIARHAQLTPSLAQVLGMHAGMLFLLA
eukprot:365634-Chlamydomonas_euryale.AAC.19